MRFGSQVIIEYAEKSGAKPVCVLPKGSELPIGLNGVGGSRISGKPKLSLHGQVDGCQSHHHGDDQGPSPGKQGGQDPRGSDNVAESVRQGDEADIKGSVDKQKYRRNKKITEIHLRNDSRKKNSTLADFIRFDDGGKNLEVVVAGRKKSTTQNQRRYSVFNFSCYNRFSVLGNEEDDGEEEDNRTVDNKLAEKSDTLGIKNM